MKLYGSSTLNVMTPSRTRKANRQCSDGLYISTKDEVFEHDATVGCTCYFGNAARRAVMHDCSLARTYVHSVVLVTARRVERVI